MPAVLGAAVGGSPEAVGALMDVLTSKFAESVSSPLPKGYLDNITNYSDLLSGIRSLAKDALDGNYIPLRWKNRTLKPRKSSTKLIQVSLKSDIKSILEDLLADQNPNLFDEHYSKIMPIRIYFTRFLMMKYMLLMYLG